MSNLSSPLEQLHSFYAKSLYKELSNSDLSEILYNNIEYLKQCKDVPDRNIIIKSLSVVLNESNHRLGLATTEGFLADYHQMLTEFPTKEQAFKFVNRGYEKVFGEKKFKTFEIFCEQTRDLPVRYNKITMKLEKLESKN